MGEETLEPKCSGCGKKMNVMEVRRLSGLFSSHIQVLWDCPVCKYRFLTDR
jgi:hypothetical protein